MTAGLFDQVTVAGRVASNRVLFGPHVTNLASGRAISARHAAYYARRAAGGCGTIVTEIASVHESDWPYERAPLASACTSGWREVVEACQPSGALVLAGLGHAGMQGSTAWTQDALWAPSLVANVLTREQPLVMGAAEIDALVAGFATGSRLATASGCDGVELNCGQHSLLRQFCSGLTNLRDDPYGEDRTLLLREILGAVRAEVAGGVVGLRFCADELAPWAGITPQLAADLVAGVGSEVDYVCVVRGSIYSEALTQPDGHVEQDFNGAATALVSSRTRALDRPPLICVQGSIVDVDLATDLVASGAGDLIEMTRAQIADPDLCVKASTGDSARVRPCILCNQHCLVRDPRNPIVSCCVNPVAGHELDDAHLDVDREAPQPEASRADVVIAGGGPAGMEAARLLARRGHRVTLVERSGSLGGAVRLAAMLPGRERLAALCDWLADEVVREGVDVVLNASADASTLAVAPVAVVATGGEPASLELVDGTDGSVAVMDAASVALAAPLAGAAVVRDVIGGPVGIGIAELVAGTGSAVTVVTPDVVVGSQLSASGDLVGANERLARRGVAVLCHTTVRGIADGKVLVEDSFTGARDAVAADLLVDAGHRWPGSDEWPSAARLVGDAVAPRGILMAMLEARRVAVDCEGTRP